MSYSCLEELQVDLDLHALDKTVVLSKVGCQCNGWFVITDDGICHFFDTNGNLDDIKKITRLKEEYIRKDITKIVIPNSITDIMPAAFYNCSGLMSVIISDCVTSIGSYAFSWCIRLTGMMIGNGVTNIWSGAFSHCSSLKNVTIGNGVTRIGFSVFDYCDSLTNLTFKGKTLEQVKKMDGYPWGIKDESIIRIR